MAALVVTVGDTNDRRIQDQIGIPFAPLTEQIRKGAHCTSGMNTLQLGPGVPAIEESLANRCFRPV
jgi:hypothetical protein